MQALGTASECSLLLTSFVPSLCTGKLLLLSTRNLAWAPWMPFALRPHNLDFFEYFPLDLLGLVSAAVLSLAQKTRSRPRPTEPPLGVVVRRSGVSSLVSQPLRSSRIQADEDYRDEEQDRYSDNDNHEAALLIWHLAASRHTPSLLPRSTQTQSTLGPGC
jgi:hypothetical protein